MNKSEFDTEMFNRLEILLSERGISEINGFVEFWDRNDVQLDGDFSIEQLQAIIDVLKYPT